MLRNKQQTDMKHNIVILSIILMLCAILMFLFQVDTVTGYTVGDYRRSCKDSQELAPSNLQLTDQIYVGQALDLSGHVDFASTLVFAAGSGQVSIDTTTGKVEHDGYTPDEAAVQFWDSVEKTFPNIKAKILKDNPCSKCNR